MLATNICINHICILASEEQIRKYAFETHHEIKSREIALVHNIHCTSPIVSNFRIVHGSTIALLWATFNNDWAALNWVTSTQYFEKFEFKISSRRLFVYCNCPQMDSKWCIRIKICLSHYWLCRNIMFTCIFCHTSTQKPHRWLKSFLVENKNQHSIYPQSLLIA